MQTVFPILILIAMALAAGTMLLGVFSMARRKPGEAGERKSNKLMQMRVLFQAVALALFAIFMLLFHH